MTSRITTIDVRKNLGDLLNKVAIRHDEYIVERKGKALAAIVPVAELEKMRQFSRKMLSDLLSRPAKPVLSDDAAMELANKAKRWARNKSRGTAEV